MHNKLQQIKKEAEERIKTASSLEALRNYRVEYLGRKGEITAVLRSLKDLAPEERAAVGQAANRVKDHLEELIELKTQELNARALQERLLQEKLDVTLPGTPRLSGGKHPLTLVREEIENIFLGLGFEIVEGPEVELDYYNFEALNMPADHPARDMQDSFYMSDEVLLRTHTSPGQVRTMEEKNPELPVKIIIPGRVYRRDDDATHSPMFHQVEGLYIGEGVTFADLKGILMLFAHKIFGQDVTVRFRPAISIHRTSEMDISCVICGGSAVAPVPIPDGWRYWARGWYTQCAASRRLRPGKGYRLCLWHGSGADCHVEIRVDDLRLFFDNDIRFLAQF